jgi:hypothetical protein
LYAELLANETWGGVSFEIESLGEFYVGLNKTAEQVASSATDFEFGLKVGASGAYQLIENNVLLASPGVVSIGDQIDLVQDHSDYVLYINDTEVYRNPIAGLVEENKAFDIVMVDVSATIGLTNYWGKYKKPSVRIEVDYPSCYQKNGDVEVFHGEGVTISSATATNNHTGAVISAVIDGVTGNAVFTDLAIATYTLDINYSTSTPFPVSYSISEQLAIGYVVSWEDLVDSYVVPLNTIQRGPGVLPAGISTANSGNTTTVTVDGWFQFETVVMNPLLAGTNGIQVIGLRDINTGAEDFRQMTGGLFIPEVKTLANAPGEDWEVIAAEPNRTWRIEVEDVSESTTFELFVDGTTLLNSEVVNPHSAYELSLYQTGTTQYINTISSYCTAIPDQFVEPKREIQGGYFLVPTDDILRFEFKEEYTAGINLDYTVRNYQGQVQGGLTDLVEEFGDNRFQLDVSSLASGTYLMEVNNDKGENWFIRFKVQ